MRLPKFPGILQKLHHFQGKLLLLQKADRSSRNSRDATSVSRALFTSDVSYVQAQGFRKFGCSRGRLKDPKELQAENPEPTLGQEKEQQSRVAGEGAMPPPCESRAALGGREQSKQRTFYEDFTAPVIPELSRPPRGQSSSCRNCRTRGEPSSQIWDFGFPTKPGILSQHFYLQGRTEPEDGKVRSFQKEGGRCHSLLCSALLWVGTWNREGQREQRAGSQPWSRWSPALVLMEQRVGSVCLSVRLCLSEAPPNQCTQR